jgi:DNA-binding transcriptional MerR regulator
MGSARRARPQGAVTAREVVACHRDENAVPLFGIAELCAELGVTPRALRFYESKQLLSPRRVGSTRVYTRRDRARLVLILRAKSIGCTLEEIRHYLELYGERGEGRGAQLGYVLRRTGELIAELEQRRRQLDATLAELTLIHGNVRRQLRARGRHRA